MHECKYENKTSFAHKTLNNFKKNLMTLSDFVVLFYFILFYFILLFVFWSFPKIKYIVTWEPGW